MKGLLPAGCCVDLLSLAASGSRQQALRRQLQEQLDAARAIYERLELKTD